MRTAAIAILGLTAIASGDVIYVDDSATGADDGSSWADAFTDLEDGLSAAASGDEVWLAEGVYRPSVRRNDIGWPSDQPKREVFLLPSGVRLIGGFRGDEASIADRAGSASLTVLTGSIGEPGTDDDARTVLLYVQDRHDTVNRARIESVRLTGAYGDTTPNSGGGLRAIGYTGTPIVPARLDIADCLIDNNRSGDRGGGLYLGAWQGVLERCVIEGNSTGVFGGGAEIYAPFHPSIVRDCVVRNNTNAVLDLVTAGGGVRVSSPPQTGAIVFERTVFEGNVAGGSGGGLMMLVTSTATPGVPAFVLRDCLFAGNHAGTAGGGFEARVFREPFSAVFEMERCTLAANTTDAAGGAGVQVTRADLRIRNSVLWDNRALGAGPETGGGLGAQIGVAPSATAAVAHSCVDGGFEGAGNIDADPLFVDAASGDFRPGPDSPLVDAGDGSGVASTTDLAGGSRVVNAARPDLGPACPAVDMGAFEFQEPCRADWNGDCRTDFVDVARFLGDWAARLDAADLDADDAWTVFDVQAFVASLLDGC